MQFQKIYTDNYSEHGRLFVIPRRWEVANAEMFFFNENMMLTGNLEGNWEGFNRASKGGRGKA